MLDYLQVGYISFDIDMIWERWQRLTIWNGHIGQNIGQLLRPNTKRDLIKMFFNTEVGFLPGKVSVCIQCYPFELSLYSVIMAYSRSTRSTRSRRMPDKAVQLVQFEEGSNRPFFTSDELTKVACSPAIRDLPTIVISIGGVARSGKSFMLNLFISYLSYVEEVRNHLLYLVNLMPVIIMNFMLEVGLTFLIKAHYFLLSSIISQHNGYGVN